MKDDGRPAGPLVDRGGLVLVDARRFPSLRRAVEADARRLREERAKWARVSEMRAAGQGDAADRLAKRLLGVQGPPMPEDKKKYLSEYKRGHKEEIRRREQQRRVARERTLALLTSAKRGR